MAKKRAVRRECFAGAITANMRALALIAVTGCAATEAIGTQGIAGGTTGSVETAVAGGIGLGSKDDAMLTKLSGTLGGGPRGVQGRVAAADEYIRFGDKLGWQAHLGFGGSFGNYQSPDLTVQVGGGAHVNVHAKRNRAELEIVSIALDAMAGYAFQHFDDGDSAALVKNPWRSDGAFLGLGLSLRRDTVSGLDFKPFH
jgi:hypothetical protein